MSDSVERDRPILALALVLALGVYALHAGDFFLFDSRAVISDNDDIRVRAGRLDDWRIAMLGTDTGPLGRPLSMLSFAMDYAFGGGLSARSLRIGNALLHALIAVALAGFLRTIFNASPVLGWSGRRAAAVAALAAILWLLHPLHVSTVLYTVQRMTQLSALFCVSTLWALFALRARWLERAPTREELSGALFLLAIGSLAAGLSKENGLLLPWLAAATELSLFRCRVGGRFSRRWAWAAGVLVAVPVTALPIVLLIDHPWLSGAYLQRGFTLEERLLTQLRVLWLYLNWTLWPDPVTLGLYRDDIRLSRSLLEPVVLAAAAAWLLTLASCWVLRSRIPLLGFAVPWYLVAHAMESGILPLEIAFEHRNYLPSMSVAALAAAICWTLPAGGGYRAALSGALALLLLSFLFARSSHWRDEVRLAEYQYGIRPESLRNHLQLVSAYHARALVEDDPGRLRAYLGSARELALRAHELAPRAAEPLVLLIQFDANSTSAGRAARWQGKLAALLEDRSFLRASEINFLRFYARCLAAGDCPQPARGAVVFLDRLSERFPARPQLRYILAEYCLQVEDWDCAREHALGMSREYPEILESRELLYRIAIAEGDARGRMQAVLRLNAGDRRREKLRSYRLTAAAPR